MHTVVTVTQHVSFIIAQITNFTIIYLIVTTKNKKLGKYKSLMLIFATYSMIYSFIEFLAEPAMFVEGSAAIIYVGSFLKNERWIAIPLQILYCAAFSVCIDLLAVQFVYRFSVVCKPDLLAYFEGVKILCMFSPVIVISVLWFIIFYNVSYPTEVQEALLDDILRYTYHEDSKTLSYIILQFYVVNGDGSISWVLAHILESFYIAFTISSSMFVIGFCGLKTYKKLSHMDCHLSDRTRQLNRQLFLALALQTILPLFTMFLPVGLFTSSPLIGHGLETYSEYVPMQIAVYPALEPLIAIFVIKDFRARLFRIGRGTLHEKTTKMGLDSTNLVSNAKVSIIPTSVRFHKISNVQSSLARSP